MIPDFASVTPLVCIGGGNMAQALIQGWLNHGLPASRLHVVEPNADLRQRLQAQHRLHVHADASTAPTDAAFVLWAIKPQIFQSVAQPLAGRFASALHLSVAAGVRSDSLARWLGTQKVVRAMPNTPALIGLGQTGLFARADVTESEKTRVQELMQSIGESLWLADESLMDAVTALSGSGPAYVFYFIESLIHAGVGMGLDANQARQLAIGTVVGAAALAQRGPDSPQTLREKVTSQGGTTHAAITQMQADGFLGLLENALRAAQKRSLELGVSLDQPPEKHG